MKILLALILSIPFVTAFAAVAQTPPIVTPQIAQLQSENDKLAAPIQLLYEDLHAITQFQQYLQVRAQYEQNSTALKAAQEAAAKPQAPAVAPAKVTPPAVALKPATTPAK